MRQRAMVSEARLELALNALSTRSLCRLGYSDACGYWLAEPKLAEDWPAFALRAPARQPSLTSRVKAGGPPEIRTPTSGIKNPALYR